MTVWKYSLEFEDEQTIAMPEGAEVLHFGNLNGPHIWARVTPENVRQGRVFSIRGTGHTHADGAYVGTAFFGSLVFHCLDMGPGVSRV